MEPLAEQNALDGRSPRSDLEAYPNGQRDRQGALPLDGALSYGGRTEAPNPEWAAERAQAAIALLPPDEQDQARREFNEIRTFWESIHQLPEPERRAGIEEHFNKPDVEARIEEQAAARDSRRTPEQREQRYRNYIRRK